MRPDATDPLDARFRAPPLADGAIHVWVLPHEDERERANALLAAYEGVPRERIAFETHAHGKPRLRGGAIEFNLSHSGALALLALARATPVGVDLERLDRRIAREDALIARCFSAEEAAAIAAARVPREALLRGWCAKEALVKAFGRGIAYGLKRVRLQWDAHDAPRIAAVDGPAAGTWQLAELDVAPGYRAALAYAGLERLVETFR